MRLLAESAILELVYQLSPSELELAEKKIPLPDVLTGEDSGWLRRAVASGRIFVSRISLDGFSVGLFFWHQSFPSTLVINGVVNETNQDLHLVIEACALQLARQNKCTEIEFQTRRPGLIRQAKRFGYKATAVVMKKVL